MNQNRRVNDPTMTRQKGMLSHPGTLLVVGMAILFTAYIFNFGGLQTWADSSFNSFNQGAQSHNDSVVQFVVSFAPLAVGLIALIVVYAILRKMGNGVKKMGKERRLSTRVSQTIQDFCEMAEQRGISHRVSRHAYRFLTPYYHDDVRAQMNDRLRDDLHLTEAKVKDAMANLLHRCDRKKNFEITSDGVITVADLMLYVEKAPTQFLTHSAVRRARGHQDAPAVVRSAAVGETRILKPLHKRSSVMNAVKRLSGIRKAAAPIPVEPRDPVARPVNPRIAIAGGREAKRDITVPTDRN